MTQEITDVVVASCDGDGFENVVSRSPLSCDRDELGDAGLPWSSSVGIVVVCFGVSDVTVEKKEDDVIGMECGPRLWVFGRRRRGGYTLQHPLLEGPVSRRWWQNIRTDRICEWHHRMHVRKGRDMVRRDSNEGMHAHTRRVTHAMGGVGIASTGGRSSPNSSILARHQSDTRLW